MAGFLKVIECEKSKELTTGQDIYLVTFKSVLDGGIAQRKFTDSEYKKTGIDFLQRKKSGALVNGYIANRADKKIAVLAFESLGQSYNKQQGELETQ